MEQCWTCHGQGWYANQDGAAIGCVYCKGSGVKWEQGEVYQRIAKLERELDALRSAINGMPALGCQPFEDPNAIAECTCAMLRRHYKLVNHDFEYEMVIAETPTLFLLLKEAVPHLQRAFPDKTVFQLEVLSHGDAMLRVVVKVLAGSGGDVPGMMREFKQNWWLQNCHRSNAGLVFDFEVIAP